MASESLIDPAIRRWKSYAQRNKGNKKLTPEHRVLDINGWPELQTLPVKYEGFCW